MVANFPMSSHSLRVSNPPAMLVGVYATSGMNRTVSDSSRQGCLMQRATAFDNRNSGGYFFSQAAMVVRPGQLEPGSMKPGGFFVRYCD